MKGSVASTTTMTGPLGHPHEVCLVDTAKSTITAVCTICGRVEGRFAGYWLDGVLLELVCATCLGAAREVLADS